MTKSILALLIAASASSGAAAPRVQWGHVANTYNSAIFVDRAVLAEKGPHRSVHMLRVNAATGGGASWRQAESWDTYDCGVPKRLLGGSSVVTNTAGGKVRLASASRDWRTLPERTFFYELATKICSGALGPVVRDPVGWTTRNFVPN